MATSMGAPSGDLTQSGISSEAMVFWNLNSETLVDMAVERGEGFFTNHGALITETGDRTGRSPNDKYVVKDDSTRHDINWGNVNVATNDVTFNRLKKQVLDYLSKQDTLFVQDLYCGTEESEALSIRVINQSAWHSACLLYTSDAADE